MKKLIVALFVTLGLLGCIKQNKKETNVEPEVIIEVSTLPSPINDTSENYLEYNVPFIRLNDKVDILTIEDHKYSEDPIRILICFEREEYSLLCIGVDKMGKAVKIPLLGRHE